MTTRRVFQIGFAVLVGLMVIGHFMPEQSATKSTVTAQAREEPWGDTPETYSTYQKTLGDVFVFTASGQKLG